MVYIFSEQIEFQLDGENVSPSSTPTISEVQGITKGSLPDELDPVDADLYVDREGVLRFEFVTSTKYDYVSVTLENTDTRFKQHLNFKIETVTEVLSATYDAANVAIPEALSGISTELSELPTIEDIQAVIQTFVNGLPTIEDIQSVVNAIPALVWEIENRLVTNVIPSIEDIQALIETIPGGSEETADLEPVISLFEELKTLIITIAAWVNVNVLKTLESGVIEETQGDTWLIEIPGLALDPHHIQAVIKYNTDYEDINALVFVDSLEGLLAINGQETDEDEVTKGSITIIDGVIYWRLSADLSALLPATDKLIFGLQSISEAGEVKETYGGKFKIRPGKVKAVS